MAKAFLAIYFFLLAYIAIYGFHLYWIISLYVRNKDRREPALENIIIDKRVPHVTMQLPVYNERTVASRLIATVAALEWPTDKLEIQVLDDSDDNTTDIIREEIEQTRRLGIKIHHIRRSNRNGFKAGALAHGLETAQGEYIAVFDADNMPRPDFLKRLIGYFINPQIGMVQARWSFINRNESLLCRAQALFLDAHFFIEQFARNKGGLFMNFNGTAGIWRKSAIIASGGWQFDTLTEDLDLSYRAQLTGWKMRFIDTVDVPTELPSSIRSFKTQQYRWARGAIETARKVLPTLMLSSNPLRVKVSAFFHLTQKSISMAIVLLALMLIPALYIRLEGGMVKLLLIDLPIFIAGTGSMSVFYGLAYKRQKRTQTTRNGMVLPLLTSIGVALAVNNSFALLSGLFSRKRSFIRTPKSGTGGNKNKILPADYRISFDSTVRIEFIVAAYSLAAIIFAVGLNLYFSIPFLLTFAFGYSYFVFRSIRESYA